jgi:tRNA nucleotidyltransferase (CCA-adding enzyme)
VQIYLVGGAVRDRLLGRPVHDRDWVVTGATPQQMIELGYRPVGRDFPVFLHPDSKEEYALARTERKSGHGYHGFVFHAAPDVSLEEDLARRDLTINAMAEDQHGNIIDPYGGRDDLTARRLRHVSDAFVEDPVRLLRVARYAARYAELGFTIATETMALLRQIVASGEVDNLVAERVWQEMERALMEQQPSLFFMTLRDCNALGVLLPEVDRLFGVPQSAQHHPEIDTGIHTMMVIDAAASLQGTADVRFAALCHDLGKGLTDSSLLPSHPDHEARGLPLIDGLCRRLRVPNQHCALARLVCQYHTHCHRAAELRPSTVLDVLEAIDAFRRPQRLDAFLLACEADSRGRTGYADKPYPQAAILKNAYHATQRVDISDLSMAGVDGVTIKNTLRERRIRAITALRPA